MAFRRTAGTPSPVEVLARGFRPPRKSALAADISAIDRGEGRTLACLFRGLHGKYPRWFGRKMLDLAPDELVIRPFWSSPIRTKFKIPREQIKSAYRRPRVSEDGKIVSDKIYPAGAFLEWSAFVIIVCDLPGGKIELGVPQPDVPLVLHYLNDHSKMSAGGSLFNCIVCSSA